MKSKIFTLILCVLLSLPFVFLSGCERMTDMISPLDRTMRTLRIGVIQSAGYNVNFSKGAELARAEINQNGGVLGMPIEFIYNNSQNAPGISADPDTSVRDATELVEQENVVAILGPIISSNAIKVAQAISRPIFTFLIDDSVTETDDFLFLIDSDGSSTSQAQLQGRLLAQFIFPGCPVTLISANDDYSISFTEAFETHFEKLSYESFGRLLARDLIESVEYKSGDTVNDLIRLIYDRKSTHLLFLGFRPEYLSIINDVWEPRLYCPSCPPPATCITVCGTLIPPTVIGVGWDVPENTFTTVLDLAKGKATLIGALSDPDYGTPLPEGIDEDEYYKQFNVFYYTRNQMSTNASQFTKNYKMMYKNHPNGIAASGYDAMHLLAIAIKTAQSVDPVTVREALSGITDYNGANLISHFDEKHRAVKNVGVFVIRNGMSQLHSVIATDTVGSK